VKETGGKKVETSEFSKGLKKVELRLRKRHKGENAGGNSTINQSCIGGNLYSFSTI